MRDEWNHQWSACRFSSTRYIFWRIIRKPVTTNFFIVLGDINLFMNADIYLSHAFAKLVFLAGLHRRAFISSFLVPLGPHSTFRYRYESKLESPAREMSAPSSKYEAPSWLMVRAVASFFFFFSQCSRKEMHLITFPPKGNPSFTTACFRSPHLHYI